MPLLFIGHGSPMNAIEDNSFTRMLKGLGKTIPKPKAIMSVSAHWLTKGTYVCGVDKPKLIYDFYGFPEKLSQVKYPCGGSPKFAKEVMDLANQNPLGWDESWGLDHGTWSVMRHIYPNADIPVFQLSIDYNNGLGYHFEIGKVLRELRNKGVLVIGSGNLVHNLIKMDFQNLDGEPYDWAVQFDAYVKARLENRNFKALINYQQIGSAANKAHPTNDHYLPMLYVLGMCDKNEPLEFIFEGYQGRSVSMRCFKVG
ncbi:MAG: 4,5-DOPA dioxygenase extradiol [Bacteroidetes bacterium]|nr:4,5-DOPA dioxygenase extradiol [Bacteroidia bacterium]PCH68282.1 MAG: 4,5-DOPA dioxygenase extradiol [Bacteroidota bacterium]